MSSRILVTGASGFIGRAFLTMLAQRQHPAIAVSRRTFTAPVGVTILPGGRPTPEAMDGCECMLHLAARAHRGGALADFSQDIALAADWARASARAGVRRFVLVSSIGVLGTRTRGQPWTEQSACEPREPYAIAKLAAEESVRRELDISTTEWTIVRPPLVYGANAPGNFERLVHAVARGWPLPLASVHNQRSLVGVRNLCDFLLACCTHPAAAKETFVIADGDDLATPDIVRCIADGLRMPARLWSLPVPLLEAAATLAGKKRLAESLCASLQVDASKARRLLGWKPLVDSHEGIAQAAAGWSFA